MGAGTKQSASKAHGSALQRRPLNATLQRENGSHEAVRQLNAAAGNRATTMALGSGTPLEDSIRLEMQSRYQADFSDVRVHTDAVAAQSAVGLQASAYSIGSDIVFGAGRYAPNSHDGKRLLAHELAHVIQQRRGGDVPSIDANAPHEQAADLASEQVVNGAESVAVQGATGVGIACAPAEGSPPPQTQAAVRYRYVAPDGSEVELSAEEYEREKQRAIKNLRNKFDQIEGLADNGRQVQKDILSEYHGEVESLWDVAANPKSLIAIAVDMRSDVIKPYIGMWSNPNASIKAGREALDRGDLADAARMLSRADKHYRSAEQMWNEYVDAIDQGGNKLVAELTVVRDVSFAIALAAGAAVAAPVIAAGAAGLGATGTTAVIATGVGTGGVVALGGAGLRGGTAALGSYTVEGKVDTKEVLAEAKRGGKEGFVTGLTAGTATGVSRVLGIGAQSTRTAQIVGGAGAGGVGGATGEVANAVIEGKSASEVAEAGIKGFGLGALGGGAGNAVAGAFKNPAAASVGSGVVSSGVSALGTFLSGGSKEEIIMAAGIGFASGLALGGAKKPPSNAERNAYQAGRKVRRTAQAATAATMIGVSNAVPVTRLPTGPAAVAQGSASSARTRQATGSTAQTISSAAAAPRADAAKGATSSVSQTTSAKPAAAAQTQARPAQAATGTRSAPDAELAKQGHRPAAGERTTTKSEWKAAEGKRRWGKAVDEAMDRAFADPAEGVEVPRARGRANPRIANKAVPGAPDRRVDIEDIPRKPGETQRQAAARVRTVIGRKLSDFPFLQKLWNDARGSILAKQTLTSSNSTELYERTRDAFWRRVRGKSAEGAQARQLLEDAGFELPKNRSTSPMLGNRDTGIVDTEKRISLDHVAEKGQPGGWQKALDADNLRMEFARPNTEREVKQMRHPELR